MQMVEIWVAPELEYTSITASILYLSAKQLAIPLLVKKALLYISITQWTQLTMVHKFSTICIDAAIALHVSERMLDADAARRYLRI